MFKKDTHSTWLDLAVFTVIVGFFLFSAARLVKRNHPGASSHAPITEINDREPASTESQVRKLKKSDAVTEVELPCLTETHRETTDASFVRISGSACTKGKMKISAGQGRNQSNGSEILCFIDAERDRISTNYFQLVPGLNRVELDLVWSNGLRRRALLEIQKFTE